MTTTQLTRSRQLLAGCVAVLCSVALSASAAPILYGDFDDIPPGAIVYAEVQEDSGTDDPPLYGPPEVVVNRLDFDPTGFAASATNGDADITDGQLNFMIDALPGAGVTSFSITEGGSYTLTGAGTAASFVGYGILVDVTILEVDGVALATPISFSVDGSETLNLADDPGIAADWEFGLLVEFGPELAGIPFDEGVSLAEIVVNNTLVAVSEPGTIAFIDKKDFFIDPEGDLTPDGEIPEPTAAALALLAAAGFASRRR